MCSTSRDERLLGAALDVLHRKSRRDQRDVADVAKAALDQFLRSDGGDADRSALQALLPLAGGDDDVLDARLVVGVGFSAGSRGVPVS
jgi:hypothetical protein